MTDRIIIAILGFVTALADQSLDRMPPGRMRGLMQKLQRQCESEFQRLGEISKTEIDSGRKVIERFADESGWNNKSRHIATIVSFLADICHDQFSDRPFMATLVEIYDYYDRAGKVPAPSNWAGARAADIVRRVSV